MNAHKNSFAALVALVLSVGSLGTLGLAAGSQSARAELSLSAVGLLNFSNVSISPSPTSSTSLGTTVGFGFLGSTSIAPMFSLEVGALYVPRKYNNNDASGNSLGSVTAANFEFPVLLRFTALPIISVGAGAYYAHSTGSLTVSTPNQSDASVSYSAAQVNTSDFGLVGSVAASIPILPFLSVMGDLRYLLGLTNLDGSGATTTHYRDIQFLAGVTLSI